MVICVSRLRLESYSSTLSDPRYRFDPTPLAIGTRVALRIEYLGTSYCGWQAQPHLPVATVQECLEQALGKVADQPVTTHCAGRTDTGVHGFAQIAHFDDPVGRSGKAWVMGANGQLPSDIRIHWAHPVDQSFHARHSALARRYRYVVANTTVRPAHLASLVTWQRRPLAVETMSAAAEALVGSHDFSAFRAAQCQANSPIREVYSLEVRRWNDFVVLDIAANGFLHHMVRNMAGALMSVGTGSRPVDWLHELLASRDRTLGADTAPSAGLYLIGVDYPADYGLPSTPAGPSWLTGYV
jgi:tRNA pseudouridine38-40 synthase